MMNRLLYAGMLMLALLIPADSTNAQTETLDRLYGQGVHAYHAGNLQQAMSLLSEAIGAGSRDPRVYYFRGLVLAGLGDSAAAAGDFHVGAEIEASPAGRFVAVGRSLERVQGPLRLQIEDARREARLMARLQQQAMAPGSPAQTLPVIPSAPVTNPTASQMNLPDVTGIENPGTPFTGSHTLKADAIPVPPVPPPMDAFGSDEKPNAQPEGDPFGSETPQPAAAPDAGEQPMEEDPFGDPKPQGDDPDPFDDSGNEPSGDKGGDNSPPDDPFGDDG